MRFFQWLSFIFYLPHFVNLAKKVEPLSFHERFKLLQSSCIELLKALKVELSITLPDELNLDQAYYLVSNHQGTFDPILLVASSPVAHSFISKVENLKLPIIGQWGRLIEFITFNRDDFNENVSMLRQATRFLKEGKSLLVFPEGTRSKSNQLNAFKVGAFLPAYMSKSAILPVAMVNAYTLKHRKKITIHYGQPIAYEAYKDLSYEDLSEQLHQSIQTLMSSYEH
jgi:1-acyl-sn-glycerol-3-phosphate acyltransferase